MHMLDWDRDSLHQMKILVTNKSMMTLFLNYLLMTATD